MMNERRRGVALAGLVAAASLSLATSCRSATLAVAVDGATRHQTIDGWATGTRYWEEDKDRDRFDSSFEPYTEAIATFLVEEVGINAVRLEISSGAENPQPWWSRFRAGEIGYREYATRRYEKINDNADPRVADPAGFQFDGFDFRVESSVLPLQRALERRGERLLLNVCFVDFQGSNAAGPTRQGSLSHADSPQEYAEMIAVHLRRLRDRYGLTADSVELVLEPEGTAGWGGRAMGAALVATADRLRAEGFSPEFLGPSTMAMGNALPYLDDLEQVPGASERLHTIVYHRYRLQRTSVVEAIRARAAASGRKTAMLERLKAGIDTLLEDLTAGGVSAWQQWGPAARLDGGDEGSVYALVDASSPPSAPRILRASRTEQLAAVFRAVRRGAVRIGSRSSGAEHGTAAFINPDGGWVVIVRTRPGTRVVQVTGLPAGTYERRFTADDGPYGDAVPIVAAEGARLDVTVPGGGVLTIVGGRDVREKASR